MTPNTPKTDKALPEEKLPAFTPAPWKVTRDMGALTLDIGVTDYVPDSDDFRGMVAWISETNGIGSDERQANARLIAAAPSLYEALKGLLEEVDAHLDYEDDPDMQKAAERAREAIQQATGDSTNA